MGLINPRLSDLVGLVIRQDEVDFVVPHLREDLPLYADPFLLWKSDVPEHRELHETLVGFVDQVRDAGAGRARCCGALAPRRDKGADRTRSRLRGRDQARLGRRDGIERGDH